MQRKLCTRRAGVTQRGCCKHAPCGLHAAADAWAHSFMTTSNRPDRCRLTYTTWRSAYSATPFDCHSQDAAKGAYLVHAREAPHGRAPQAEAVRRTSPGANEALILASSRGLGRAAREGGTRRATYPLVPAHMMLPATPHALAPFPRTHRSAARARTTRPASRAAQRVARPPERRRRGAPTPCSGRVAASRSTFRWTRSSTTLERRRRRRRRRVTRRAERASRDALQALRQWPLIRRPKSARLPPGVRR